MNDHAQRIALANAFPQVLAIVDGLVCWAGPRADEARLEGEDTGCDPLTDLNVMKKIEDSLSPTEYSHFCDILYGIHVDKMLNESSSIRKRWAWLSSGARERARAVLEVKKLWGK